MMRRELTTYENNIKRQIEVFLSEEGFKQDVVDSVALAFEVMQMQHTPRTEKN